MLTVEETIARSQERLNRALVEGDAATLEELVAAECRIIGPKGFMIAKDEWIGVHSSNVYEQVLLETTESELVQHGDTAIRCDMQHSECVYQDQLISGRYRVLSVWTRPAGSWQLAAVQYTEVSAEAVGQ